jgi:serine/threonine protein phosphatase PrpC
LKNQEVIEQTLQNYEIANQALFDLWDQFEPQVIDEILEKQQNRLQQIADRLYHQEQFDEFSENETVLLNTIQRYEWANQYLYEHWNSLSSEERLAILQKQWNRLEEMRRRHENINIH